MIELYVRNRQRTHRINLPLFKEIASNLITRICGPEARIGVILVGDREITRLNEAYLQHRGSTDVLAFGYAAEQGSARHGELFVCVDEALRMAPRFRATWQKEVVRYLIHGLLHLQGHEDSTPAQRRRMKLAENALVKKAAKQFALSDLSEKASVRL